MEWHSLEPALDDRALLTLAVSALAWSVGRFEGMDVDPGYAGSVLEQLCAPQQLVVDDSSGSTRDPRQRSAG